MKLLARGRVVGMGGTSEDTQVASAGIGEPGKPVGGPGGHGPGGFGRGGFGGGGQNGLPIPAPSAGASGPTA